MEARKPLTRNQKIAAVFIVIGFAAVIAGVIFLGYMVFGNHVYDVQNITDEEILNGSHHIFSSYSYESGHKNGKEYVNMQMTRFGGIETVKTARIEKEAVTFRIDSTLTKGELRIFVVNETTGEITEVPANKVWAETFSSTEKSKYSVKTVGSNASCKISVITEFSPIK